MMMVMVDTPPGIHTMQVSEVVSWKMVDRLSRRHWRICAVVISCIALAALGTLLLIWRNNVEYRHYTVPPVPDTPVPIWHNSVA